MLSALRAMGLIVAAPFSRRGCSPPVRRARVPQPDHRATPAGGLHGADGAGRGGARVQRCGRGHPERRCKPSRPAWSSSCSPSCPSDWGSRGWSRRRAGRRARWCCSASAAVFGSARARLASTWAACSAGSSSRSARGSCASTSRVVLRRGGLPSFSATSVLLGAGWLVVAGVLLLLPRWNVADRRHCCTPSSSATMLDGLCARAHHLAGGGALDVPFTPALFLPLALFAPRLSRCAALTSAARSRCARRAPSERSRSWCSR